MSATLLVYTESDSFRDYWSEVAAAADLELHVAGDLDEAARSAVVIISCPGSEDRAADRVRDAAAVAPRPPAVVGTRGDHRIAVDVVRAGADDYFVLPDEAERLRDYVGDRAQRARDAASRAELAESAREDFDFSRIVAESRSMKEALARAARIIPRGAATVLITGETGTGKGLLAQTIHYNGPRAEGPFVDLNCSAIPATLLESELFGHERGAFTDARRAKPGLFEVADGGTLFLDEIGSLPFELQGKLLKAIEDKKIRRVGGTKTIATDVRILAATNADLASAVEDESFREDLYYRLSVIPIHLPPLRERGDDILLLSEHFLNSLSEQYDMVRPEMGRPVRERLLAHSWPGNVRELRNAIERALLLSDGETLQVEDLFDEGKPGAESLPTGLPFPAPLEAIELAAVREMLRITDGNKSAAARRLGISRSRLHRLAGRLQELEGERSESDPTPADGV